MSTCDRTIWSEARRIDRFSGNCLLIFSAGDLDVHRTVRVPELTRPDHADLDQGSRVERIPRRVPPAKVSFSAARTKDVISH